MPHAIGQKCFTLPALDDASYVVAALAPDPFRSPAWPVLRAASIRCERPSLFVASGIARAPAACSSTQSAGASVPAMRLVRITHPFHPLSGREVACVGERYNRYGRRLLLRVDDVTVCSVPPQWTDLVAPDPEIVIGEYRALLRVADLLELERLVDQLRKRDS